MDKKILKLGIKKFKKLTKEYKGFVNVIIDDWRGYRFIFDTIDVENCQNDCRNCNLFKLLKNERDDLFSAGLYPASEDDKKIFGPQNYLNCKTARQYQKCYLNFLNNLKNDDDIKMELDLVKNLAMIYCRGGKMAEKERSFKQSILKHY